MRRIKRYLLDSSVYCVLVDKNEKDYETVRSIIDYAKKNRERFVTTFVIAKELDSKKIDKSFKDVILPEYYSSISIDAGILEILCSDKFKLVKNLAWNYIQRLRKGDANEVIDDASIYAWCGVAGIDTFVTRNRRGILAEDYWRILKMSNDWMRINKFVKIMSPNEFYDSLV